MASNNTFKYVRLDSGEFNCIASLEILKKGKKYLKEKIHKLRQIQEQADKNKRDNIVVKLTNTNSIPAFIPLEKAK